MAESCELVYSPESLLGAAFCRTLLRERCELWITALYKPSYFARSRPVPARRAYGAPLTAPCRLLANLDLPSPMPARWLQCAALASSAAKAAPSSASPLSVQGGRHCAQPASRASDAGTALSR